MCIGMLNNTLPGGLEMALLLRALGFYVCPGAMGSGHACLFPDNVHILRMNGTIGQVQIY